MQLISLDSASDAQDIFSCRICLKKPNHPLLCPSCSKFFCEKCIKNTFKHKQSRCPSCNISIQNQLTIPLKHIIMQFTQAHQRKCQLHNMDKQYYCKQCKLSICSDCIIITSNHSTHQILKITEIQNNFDIKNNLFKDKVTSVRNNLVKIKQHLIENNSSILCHRDNQLSTFDKFMKNLYDRITHKINTLIQKEQLEIVNQNQQLKILSDKYLQLIKQLQTMTHSKLLANHNLIRNQIQSLLTHNYKSNIIPKHQPIQSQIVPQYHSKKFILNNYTSIRERKDFLYSQIFYCGNLQWRLKIYPNGISDDEQSNEIRETRKRRSGSELATKQKSDGYLSIYIELKNGLQKVGKYRHKVEITNHIKPSLKLQREFQSEFESGQCWGYDSYAKIQTLYEQGYVHPIEDYMEITLYVGPPTYYDAVLDQDTLLKQKLQTIKKNQIEIKQLKKILNIKDKVGADETKIQKVQTPVLNTEDKNYKIKYQNFAAIIDNNETESENQSEFDLDVVKLYVKTQIKSGSNYSF